MYAYVLVIVLFLLLLCKDKNDLISKQYLPIYTSLTTIPERAENTEKVIQGLMKQTYPIEKIFLNIPVGTFKRTGSTYYVPEWTKKREYQDKLIVSRTPEYGPGTKLLGSLDFIPQDAYIYVVDDDRVYSPNHLKNLVSYLNSGVDVVSNGMCGLYTYVCGVTGFIVKRSIINDIVEYYNKVPDECRTVDDIWITAYLKHKHANVRKTNYLFNITFLFNMLRDRFVIDKNSLFHTVNKDNVSIINFLTDNTKNSYCKRYLE